MKQDIHPIYYPKAKVKCACGNTFTVGATKEAMTVEICSHCHPFYTGTEKLIDIAGRVEKFRIRQEAAKKRAIAKPLAKKKVKIADTVKTKGTAKKKPVKTKE
ncbi:MAG: 50S ribosomal protein L31 [Candidatus Colwellbacteria bacterium]|nr:50S ribosomal protein L31 [Candidatus Colwellbacteria bacterium]